MRSFNREPFCKWLCQEPPARAQDQGRGSLRRGPDHGGSEACHRVSAGCRVVFAVDISRRMVELRGRSLPMWTTHSAGSAVHPIERNGSAHVPAGTSRRVQRLNVILDHSSCCADVPVEEGTGLEHCVTVLHGSAGGRTEPTPCHCLNDANGFRTSKFKKAIVRPLIRKLFDEHACSISGPHSSCLNRRHADTTSGV
jgi:hypothetical protein